MSLKVVSGKSRKQAHKQQIKEQARELAQLALDIFNDKRHVVGAQSGQNYANQQKKH